MVVKSLSWKATLLGLLFTLPFGACDCGGEPPSADGGALTCGAGTVEKNGQCVPEETPPVDGGPDLECGPGTVPSADGSQCVPDLNCPAGTAPTNDGTGCVPLCDDPFILEGTECVCPAGLVPTPGGNDCAVDPALCGEGTVFVDGACLPAVAPAPGDDDINPDEAPVSFDLPAAGEKPYEVGGVVGPVDRADGADVDIFEFDGTAGDRLLIQVLSFGAQAGSFIVQGIPGTPTEPYFRAALPLANRRAVRHAVLPLTGRYAIIVTDKSNLVGGLPTGGDDHTYSLFVSTEASVAPTVVTADGTSFTGAHDDIPAFRVDPGAVPGGSILSAQLAASDVDPDADTVQILWYVDPATSEYVEITPPQGFFGFASPAVNALLAQISSGLTVHVDYWYRLGVNPAWDYDLTLTRPTVHAGPTANGPAVDGNTQGDELTFFEVDLQADQVYRLRMRLPESTTIDGAYFGLVDQALNVVAFSAPRTVDGVDYEELRYFAGADAAGTYYVAVVDEEEQDPLAQPNFNVRLALEEAPLVFTASVSLPDNGTATSAFDDPSNLDADAWTGPWILTRAGGIVDLTLKTDSDVTFETFHAGTFATVSGAAADTGVAGEFARFYQLPPGVQLLVHARDGDQTGQFNFTATAEASAFNWETEPNDGAGSANPLPDGETWSGFLQEGDADWWAITVTSAGRLTVTTEEGPLGDSDHFLSIFDTDGTTLLGGPDFGGFDFFGFTGAEVSAYLPAAGTYYAVVEHDFPGDYSLSWTFDDTVPAPSTCDAPIVVASSGDFSGDLSDGARNWEPADSGCTGFDSYAGPDHVYSLTIPAGASLRAIAASFNADLALALAPAGSACNEACLAGIDDTASGTEELIYVNESSTPMDALLIVDGFGSRRGTYDLTIEIFGDACLFGEQRCTDGNTLEVCNATLDGFDVVSCPGGCEFDAFEQRGSCVPICGPGTDGPIARCDGATLQSCTDDQARYEPTSCAVACTDLTDPGTTDIVDALCTFDVCAGPGSTTCADEDIGGVTVGVESLCNDDASGQIRLSCANGCDGAGTGCSLPTLPAPVNGACPAGTAPGTEVAASGYLTLDPAAFTNDLTSSNNACASYSGLDFFFKLPSKAAGTEVRVRVQGSDFDPVLGFQLQCDDGSGTCLDSIDTGFDGDSEELVYTYDGSETGGLLAIIDSFGTTTAPIDVEIEFSDDPLSLAAPSICTPDAQACDSNANVATACDATGTVEARSYCHFGCNATGDGCEQLTLGESCDAPGTVPPLALVAGTATFPLDLTGYAHELTGTCRDTSTAPEGVFAFIAPFNGLVVLETSGRDTVMYAREALCDGTELSCDDDGGPGTGSRVELDLTAGTEYFVVVELYSSSTTPTDITLTMTLTEQ